MARAGRFRSRSARASATMARTSRGGAGWDSGAARGGTSGSPAQTSRPPPGRSGLRLRCPQAALEGSGHPPHHPPKARSQAKESRSGRKTGRFRRYLVRETQRGGEVRKQAQAVARYSDSLREAGTQLPSGGGDRVFDDVVGMMIRQTRPSQQGLANAEVLTSEGVSLSVLKC
jgi:hypothetical protein